LTGIMPNPYNLESIFKKYKDKVYRLGLSITRNERDAEDVLQNTFLKAIGNLRYFRRKSSISTWIYRIAYNEALQLLRRKRSQFKLKQNLKQPVEKRLSGLFVNWAKLPDRELLDKELKERVNLIIRAMPIKYRMPLLLDNVEGLSLKEAAKILKLKVNSLKTRLHRAHLLIKQEMSDYFRDKEMRQEKQSKRCGIWTGFVYNYSKGYLDKRRASEFRQHIRGCRGCSEFIGSYLKAIQITKALECQDLPPELKDKIETFLQHRHLNIGKRKKR